MIALIKLLGYFKAYLKLPSPDIPMIMAWLNNAAMYIYQTTKSARFSLLLPHLHTCSALRGVWVPLGSVPPGVRPWREPHTPPARHTHPSTPPLCCSTDMPPPRSPRARTRWGQCRRVAPKWPLRGRGGSSVRSGVVAGLPRKPARPSPCRTRGYGLKRGPAHEASFSRLIAL